MVDKMIKNLEEKTGKSLDYWIKTVKNCGEEKHMAKIKFLKEKHGLTHGYANLIVHSSKEGGISDSKDDLSELVAKQYEKKQNLKPIYDELIKKISSLGSDVEIAPKKAYVSLRRKKQFGLIQPSTKTRVDVGINLKGTDPTERLEASGSFNSMVSHRVRITEKSQIDKEMLGWLKAAYTVAG